MPELIPLLLVKVTLYIRPLLPTQLIAPPSSPATLSIKVELAIIQLLPSIYIAPPSKTEEEFLKVQSLMVKLCALVYIDPPFIIDALPPLTKLIPFNITVVSLVILNILAELVASIVKPLPLMVISFEITIPLVNPPSDPSLKV